MIITIAGILFLFFLSLSNFTTDIDECVATPGKCHNEAACNNTHGSYVCTCKPGYIGDGLNCTGTVNSLKFLCLVGCLLMYILVTWQATF